ncbi:hypothetical protein [Anabaena sp. 4-3]|uniref:hypothetical protein n=1 Tax=Anabaena sp. 4-3 TaxID=1811979 RepID=UPI0018D3E130
MTSTGEQLHHSKQRSQLNESVTSQSLQDSSATTIIKAITLHQPWAYLVGRYKWFETRDWPTNYRGKIAIHAAKKQKDTDYWCSLLQDFLPPVEELIFGAVIAVADLTDCIKMTPEFIAQQSDTEIRCGNWEVGRYAWKLENVQILPEPIPARGKQRLWNIELSIKSQESRVKSPHVLTRANARPETYIVDQYESLGVISNNLGFGFVVDWLGFGTVPNPPSGKNVTYNWERDDEEITRLAIAPQSLVTKFLEENHPQTLVERDYTCNQCPPQQLNEEYGTSEWTPEIFLEENQEAVASAQQPKPSRQKGCLYKYLENKKLKDGSIASYPRVIGHREPDNPRHWRWGFNWEEKVNGEWKGRSIGSVPVGAIPMIQSMQKDDVALEEIIGFIRRAKAKKS